jgi:hypothetical protein
MQIRFLADEILDLPILTEREVRLEKNASAFFDINGSSGRTGPGFSPGRS